jgi:hypothetical protein
MENEKKKKKKKKGGGAGKSFSREWRSENSDVATQRMEWGIGKLLPCQRSRDRKHTKPQEKDEGQAQPEMLKGELIATLIHSSIA